MITSFSKQLHEVRMSSISDSLNLKDPKVLGPNYETVLHFWSFVETLNQEQREIIHDNHDGVGHPSYKRRLESLCSNVTSYRWSDFCRAAKTGLDLSSYKDVQYAVAWATMELIVMDLLMEGEHRFFYLKKFEAVQQLAQ